MSSVLLELNNQLYLLSIKNLRNGLINNKIKEADNQKKQEGKINAEKTTFFFDTELIIVNEEIIVILVKSEQEQNFLFQNYNLKQQEICLQIGKIHKHIVVINQAQKNLLLENQDYEKKQQAIILLKDEKSIEESTASFFEKIT